MKRFSMVAGLAVFMAYAPAVSAMTDVECQNLWKSSDVNADGVLTSVEATRFLTALRDAGKPAAGDTLPQMTFMEHCKADAFKTAAMPGPTLGTTEQGKATQGTAATGAGTGVPQAGANSFTEAQAMERITAAGFSQVTGLKKDANGVWRGTAMEGNKSLNVALDYQGNVVAER